MTESTSSKKSSGIRLTGVSGHGRRSAMSKSNARRKPAAVVDKPADNVVSFPRSVDELARALADDCSVVEDFAEGIFGACEAMDMRAKHAFEAASAVQRLAWEIVERITKFRNGLDPLSRVSRPPRAHPFVTGMDDDLAAVHDYAYVIDHLSQEKDDRYGGPKEPTISRLASAISRRVAIIEREFDQLF
jgi:hypothetical protein